MGNITNYKTDNDFLNDSTPNSSNDDGYGLKYAMKRRAEIFSQMVSDDFVDDSTPSTSNNKEDGLKRAMKRRAEIFEQMADDCIF